MKSERRHELETNQLATILAKLPELMHRYGSRILLAVALLFLVSVFIYTRISASRTAAAESANALAFVREQLQSLQQYQPLNLSSPEDRRNAFRTQVQEINDALDYVVNHAKGPKVLAEALVARGDLNWLIATYPELPEATTRPALQLQEDRETPLNIAFESYNNVLDAYGDQPLAVLSAHFGLAAIAENRGDWKTARQHYQAIVENDQFAEAFREQARQRIDNLDEVSQPVLIVQRPPVTEATPQTSQTAEAPQPPSTSLETSETEAEISQEQKTESQTEQPAVPTTQPAE